MKYASANRVFIGKIEKWSRSGTSFSHTQGTQSDTLFSLLLARVRLGGTVRAGPGGTLGVSNGRRQCLWRATPPPQLSIPSSRALQAIRGDKIVFRRAEFIPEGKQLILQHRCTR